MTRQHMACRARKRGPLAGALALQAIPFPDQPGIETKTRIVHKQPTIDFANIDSKPPTIGDDIDRTGDVRRDL